VIESIPSERWSNACEDFAQRHRGWLVRLFVIEGHLNGGTSERELAIDEPLLAILVEPQTRDPRVCILVGREAAHATHCSAHPRTLSFEYQGDGREAGLRIEDRGGDLILLRFRVAAPGETLDGLAPTEH